MLNTTSCCGLMEAEGISDYETPEQVLETLAVEMFNNDKSCAFVVFTGVIKEGYIEPLIRKIKKLKLGTVYTTRAKVNPNSGNKIIVAVWSVNARKLRSWAIKQGVHLENDCDCDDCKNDNWW